MEMCKQYNDGMCRATGQKCSLKKEMMVFLSPMRYCGYAKDYLKAKALEKLEMSK